MTESAYGLVHWEAFPGPQRDFLASTALEALYGGAAGGGKSDALLMGALKYAHLPSYRALLLRRTFPELLRSLIPKSFLRYLPIGGKPNMSSQPSWRMPSGAVIEFGHLQHEHDVHKYQSAEYQYIGFDELTSFTEAQYVYMLSRLRGTDGIPVRARAGTNPGGAGHDWVFRRWAPWLDPAAKVTAEPGRKLCYRNGTDGPEWLPVGVAGPMSRTFFPARASDNPYLDAGYSEILGGLDRVTRAQLLDGDWLIKPAAGAYFQRGWVTFVDGKAPRATARVRAWDLAATAPGEASDPDWTVGALMSVDDVGMYAVEDVVRARLSPGHVEDLIKATAELDGASVVIDLPQDPGQAGKSQAAALIKKLAGWPVYAKPVTGDKVTRFKPFSAQAEAGNVRFTRGPWNQVAVEELEAFPSDGMHDDIVDACSSAFNRIARPFVTLGTGPVTAGERRASAHSDDTDDDDNDSGTRW